MVAKVTLGFVKDARSHIDVQGFNVYHKNRLIKVSCLCSSLHMWQFFHEIQSMVERIRSGC